MIIIKNYAEFESHLSKELGVSDWHTITQQQIDKFADATIDHQWIHTDTEKAKNEGPFGGTIAHGYLTVSLLPYFWHQIADVQNLKMQINYAIDSIKFGQPVLVDTRVRLKAKLAAIVNLRGITKATIGVEMEIEGQKKPAYTGKVVFLYHFNG
jgi:acyl dehydratase